MFSAGLNQSTRNTGLVSWHHKGCLSLVWFPQIYCIYLKKRVHSTLLENIFQHHFIKYHTFYGDDVFETKVDTSLVSFRSYWYSQVRTAKSIFFIKSMAKKKNSPVSCLSEPIMLKIVRFRLLASRSVQLQLLHYYLVDKCEGDSTVYNGAVGQEPWLVLIY